VRPFCEACIPLLLAVSSSSRSQERASGEVGPHCIGKTAYKQSAFACASMLQSLVVLMSDRTDSYQNHKKRSRPATLSKFIPLPLTHNKSSTPDHRHQRFLSIASGGRQAQARIRRDLEVNSYDLAALERYLIRKGHIPESTNEQASRDAVFKLRKLCDQDLHACPLNAPGKSMRELFSASSGARNDTGIQESESAKYDAFMDLVLMLAVRKAETLATQHQQEESRVLDTAAKAEGAWWQHPPRHCMYSMT
jgi:hypothetical protein